MTTSPAPISAADREKAKELCAKATPGPWTAKIEPTSYPECDDADLPLIVRGENGEEVTSIDERYRNGAELQAKQATYEIDGELIAFSRTAIPAFEARVVELEATIRLIGDGHVRAEAAEARATALLEALTRCESRMSGHPMWDSDDAGPCQTLLMVRAAINAGASNGRS